MNHFILGKGLWFSVPIALFLLLIFSGNVNPSSNEINNIYLSLLLIGFIVSLPWSLVIATLFAIIVFGYNDTWWSSPLLIFFIIFRSLFCTFKWTFFIQISSLYKTTNAQNHSIQPTA